MRLRRIQAKAAERAEKSAKTAELNKRRSPDSIYHIQDWEDAALRWIYHKHSGRARVSINYRGIQGLQNLGLLEREEPINKRTDFTDCIVIIPEHIRKKRSAPDPLKKFGRSRHGMQATEAAAARPTNRPACPSPRPGVRWARRPPRRPQCGSSVACPARES